MRIPVFVSCPTNLSNEQKKIKQLIVNILDELKLEPRALGTSEYPKDYPLKEVYITAKHCAGGLILGFEQTFINKGIRHRGHKIKEATISNLALPTPWNHLEAGILYGLKLPIMIFKEPMIEGGVFDNGITDVFIHKMPPSNPNIAKKEELKDVFLKWRSEVEAKYRAF